MDIKQQIIDLINNNESVPNISKKLGITVSYVYKIISKFNINISNNTNIKKYNKSSDASKPIYTIDNDAKYKKFKSYAGQLISDRNAGYSIDEVCKKYDIARPTLTKYLKHYYRYESI